MQKIAIYCIDFYQKYLSRDTGKIPKMLGLSKPTCMYFPTCSEYTKQAIIRFGTSRGIYLGFKRILRCNPFNEPGVDLVPEKTK